MTEPDKITPDYSTLEGGRQYLQSLIGFIILLLVLMLILQEKTNNFSLHSVLHKTLVNQPLNLWRYLIKWLISKKTEDHQLKMCLYTICIKIEVTVVQLT